MKTSMKTPVKTSTKTPQLFTFRRRAFMLTVIALFLTLGLNGFSGRSANAQSLTGPFTVMSDSDWPTVMLEIGVVDANGDPETSLPTTWTVTLTAPGHTTLSKTVTSESWYAAAIVVTFWPVDSNTTYQISVQSEDNPSVVYTNVQRVISFTDEYGYWAWWNDLANCYQLVLFDYGANVFADMPGRTTTALPDEMTFGFRPVGSTDDFVYVHAGGTENTVTFNDVIPDTDYEFVVVAGNVSYIDPSDTDVAYFLSTHHIHSNILVN